MSRGPGQLQLSILNCLRDRHGGDVLEDIRGYRLVLARGIHDARAVAREMTRCRRGYSDPVRQAAFSRALAGLVARGMVTALSVVPIAGCEKECRHASLVHDLSDGMYIIPPLGSLWRRRFLKLA